jgi:hypothetical protein
MPENTPYQPTLPPEPYVDLYLMYRAELLDMGDDTIRVLCVAAMDEIEARKQAAEALAGELLKQQQQAVRMREAQQARRPHQN